MANLKNAFDRAPGGEVTIREIKSTLGPTCGSCVFSQASSPTWQPYVEDTGGAYDNRNGSCFAQRSGPVCGRAMFRLDVCAHAVCPSDACGNTEACFVKATKGPCRDVALAFNEACPNATSDSEACGDIFAIIAASCSGGPPPL